jgi:chromosome partitioning protein
LKKGHDLGGMAEVAKALGTSRQLISLWRTRYPSFPKPIASLRMGPIWDMRDIREWKAKHDA